MARIPELINALPKSAYKDERFYSLKNRYAKPKTWGMKSIVIYSGSAPEQWSPASIYTGIGGSEEAVIYLAKEFKILGYEVTVFNDCGEMEGQYDGVIYKDYHSFNTNDIYDIFIAWRQNMFPLVPIKARKKIVWLHDIPYAEQFYKTSETFFDRVVVLSQYHKSLLPEHIQNSGKVYVSTNGINPIDFNGLEMILRNPHRIIYASSYDRGIHTILVDWHKIKKEVPDAELHLYYGWDVYDKFIRDGNRKQEVKNLLVKLMNQKDIFEHGRIGHKELLKEYAKSGVWAYPSNFMGEINCIALTKAIACGCNIITNKFAVLGERSPNAVDDKDFIEDVIKSLQEMQQPVDTKQYIQDNSWETVARAWEKDMFV